MKKYYWITPASSNKQHIAENGLSLCNYWMMTDTSAPVTDTGKIVVQSQDCRLCVKQYNNRDKK